MSVRKQGHKRDYFSHVQLGRGLGKSRNSEIRKFVKNLREGETDGLRERFIELFIRVYTGRKEKKCK